VDRIITDLAVFDVARCDSGKEQDDDGVPRLALRRLAPGVTLDEVRAKTEPEFAVVLEDAAEGVLA
jgi:3-oxoacid CoA-transferase subunit B